MQQADELSRVVLRFALRVHSLPDADLDRTWQWMGYDEGVRFACFRMMERLRLLAVQIEQTRQEYSSPINAAQRTLAQYHIAYREMQALLLGLSDEDGARRFKDDEWSVRIALAHLIEADRGFYGVIHYAIERVRTGDGRPLEMNEEEFVAFLNQGDFFTLAESGPLNALLEYFENWHGRVLADLSTLQAAELELPSIYWEPQPMSLQFRLHRFEAHLRQHTIQIEKTLAALGLQQQEAIRLVRLIFSALGEAEGMMLGLTGQAKTAVAAIASSAAAEISRLDQEISEVLK